MREKTMQTVIKVILEHLDVAESKVTPEAHLVNDLGADPFDTVELVIQVEKATGVKTVSYTHLTLPTILLV